MGKVGRIIVMALAGLWLNTQAASAAKPEEMLLTWYKLQLELVRHTPTYSPPVASRAFAYVGVTAFEAAASGDGDLKSLAGQLNGLEPSPTRDVGAAYDEALVMQAAMATVMKEFFANTGPTGQRAIARLEEKLRAQSIGGVPADVAERSEAYGVAVARHVLAWSQKDGGAVVENLGFPLAFELAKAEGSWAPTSTIPLQQTPLLPKWGDNRPFAMPAGTSCSLPAPPAYSEEKSSPYFREALEVVETRKNLTPEQRAIARFWSDDPMLSPTPPGHWMSIALQILERQKAPLDRSVDVLARLGIAVADSFIGCWNTKFEYNTLRPVTFIRKTMDPKWESLMITPPFPEYPSGHSTQSAAAALVLTSIYGENYAFDDATHAKDGIKPRRFASFQAAAEDAGLSRLYGGIHFRSAIEQGLAQGRCVGQYAAKLRTRN
jgi:PAP2 superfamily